MINIIDGRKISQHIKDELREKVSRMTIKPKLSVIIVGDDPASVSYVKAKEKACTEIGIESETIRFPVDVTEKELVDEIYKLDTDNSVSGILVQLPLPDHIDRNKIIDAIYPNKDVDGFTTSNLGNMVIDGSKTRCPLPCTPIGIIELIRRSGIDLSGCMVTVIGRSNIVGKPLVNLLSSRDINATVIWCNSKTEEPDIKFACDMSDCIILACGKPNVIPYNWIPEGCAVIDVGVNRVEDKTLERGYRLVGDVYDSGNRDMMDYLDRNNITITPVPGGVGPMTIAMLMNNVVNMSDVFKTGVMTNE